MPLFRRKSQTFNLHVQDMLLRVTAPEEFYEECRAAALSVWEQVSSYSIRNPLFRTSKRPVEVQEDAPAVVREMAAAARSAGVGPVFTVQGAVTDHVGRYLSRSLPEVMVSAGGDYFVKSRKRMKVPVHEMPAGDRLSVIVDPGGKAIGVSTTLGRGKLPADSVDGFCMLASSCVVADAAAAAAMAILTRPDSFHTALAYLRGIDGIRGAVLVRGEQIGVAGGVEVAA